MRPPWSSEFMETQRDDVKKLKFTKELWEVLQDADKTLSKWGKKGGLVECNGRFVKININLRISRLSGSVMCSTKLYCILNLTCTVS